MDCLFCKIADGSTPSDVVYTDDNLVAFSDIAPKAPIHKLIIPRLHLPTLNEASDEHQALLGNMVLCAKTLAKQYDIDDGGYRLVFNCNKDAGQMVFHIHLHLLGGRALTWPPG